MRISAVESEHESIGSRKLAPILVRHAEIARDLERQYSR